MPEQRSTEKSVFLEAIEIESAADREAFLARACAGDARLRAAVEALLRAHVVPQQVLDAPEAVTPTAPDAGRADGPGKFIGPYKVLQPLGEGGMGTVFMAEQTHPVQRKVALKVVKPGMETSQVIARFEAERQALAMMEHPNIARVLDAGETDAGRPFFVMELVKGTPITQFCDDYQLSPCERLELFVPVCQAVQHAHQKGVIHRDVKPSNVLVALYDDRPVPKVIDFGVARATGPKLTERTLFTQFGQLVGTLEYMSPEQATFNNLDIDTRSDVYSLGVLLYELLTGSTPLESRRLRTSAFEEVLRIIREEEPPRPSTRLSTTAELPSIAARRKTEPAKLGRVVRGDLDWIVMKCLEKDRNRRYQTANSLAADVQRFLADEAVQARPPSAGYRLRKFVRRHKAGVFMAAAFVGLLLAAVAVSAWLAVKATAAEGRALANEEQSRQAAGAEHAAREAEAEQRRQAEAAAELLESVFVGLDPVQGQMDFKAQLVGRLDALAASLETGYTGEPLVRARLRNTLGTTLVNLGEYAKAGRVLEQALAERQQHLPADHPDVLDSMHNLARVHLYTGGFDKAVPLFERALERRQAVLGPDHRDTLTTMNNLALTLKRAGEVDRAIDLMKETLRRRRAALGPTHDDTMTTTNNLAAAYVANGRSEEAVPLLDAVYRARQADYGPDHYNTLLALNNLAMAHHAAGRWQRAVPLLEETLERRRVALGATHPHTLSTMANLAQAYQSAGRQPEARLLLDRALEGERARIGDDHPDTLLTMLHLARASESADPTRAEALYREVAERARRKRYQGPLDDALGALGGHLSKQGKHVEAEPLLRESLAHRRKDRPNDWATFGVQALLGGALLGRKQYAEAEAQLLEAYEALMRVEDKIPPHRRGRVTETLEQLVQLYGAWGKAEKAAQWRARLEARKKGSNPPKPGAG